MVKLRMISTRQLVQPLDIPTPEGYAWILIPYSGLEMLARRDTDKCAHVQLVRSARLEEP